MGITWEYASMMTDKQHNAQLEEADALEVRVEELAESLYDNLKQGHFVLDAIGDLIHIEDFICDVEIDPHDMSLLICGYSGKLQVNMQKKLYEFSAKIATDIIEAKKL
jgi:hypothetical protein